MSRDQTEPIAANQLAKADSISASLSVPPAALPAAQTSAGASASQQGTPAAASDSDLIEEEWVAIVKRIIAENKDDPYNLNKAMTLLRADYMKKRYGKDIKLVD